MKNYFEHFSRKNPLPASSRVYVDKKKPLPTEVLEVQFSKDKKATETNFTLQSQSDIDKLKNLTQNGGWIHISGLKNTKIIYEICNVLNIHILTVEDILNTEQLTKIEFLPDYTLIITKAPIFSNEDDVVHLQQISFILKDKLLISFQQSHASIIEEVENYLGRLTTKSLIFDNAHILYLLLDMIIDQHLLVVDRAGNNLEALEEIIIQNHENIQAARLYTLKRDMLHMRKNAMGLRDIINMLVHEHKSVLPRLPLIYLRDLQDHLTRIVEAIDIHRELSKNILDIYMSSVNTKLNETMKVLAVFAAIFIPLTFITGFYGMNFPEIPALHWKYGYPFALGLMVSVAGGLLYYFRRKHWI